MSNLDDEYDDDNSNSNDPWKQYFKKIWFKFDPNMFADLSWTFNTFDFPFKSVPVNNSISNAGVGNSLQYLGSNYDSKEVWKSKYFICDSINIEYLNHIKQHAAYFLRQPTYYKGMFNILN